MSHDLDNQQSVQSTCKHKCEPNHSGLPGRVYQQGPARHAVATDRQRPHISQSADLAKTNMNISKSDPVGSSQVGSSDTSTQLTQPGKTKSGKQGPARQAVATPTQSTRPGKTKMSILKSEQQTPSGQHRNLKDGGQRCFGKSSQH